MYTIKLIKFLKHLQVGQGYFWSLPTRLSQHHRLTQDAKSPFWACERWLWAYRWKSSQINLCFLLNNMFHLTVALEKESNLERKRKTDSAKKFQKIILKWPQDDIYSFSSLNYTLTDKFLRWRFHSLSQIVLKFFCLCSHYIIPI